MRASIIAPLALGASVMIVSALPVNLEQELTADVIGRELDSRRFRLPSFGRPKPPPFKPTPPTSNNGQGSSTIDKINAGTSIVDNVSQLFGPFGLFGGLFPRPGQQAPAVDPLADPNAAGNAGVTDPSQDPNAVPVDPAVDPAADPAAVPATDPAAADPAAVPATDPAAAVQVRRSMIHVIRHLD
ncbi:hypothetical protein DL96DRAFT_1681716 [Flagelloscypha sp. PMI_526]|nr:hypothetical protein DL96DRAFT_1681716 [Flagelloscypha sp. PMI_526]